MRESQALELVREAIEIVGTHSSVPTTVNKVLLHGRPLSAVKIYVTLRYLASDPVCCAEPGCYVPFLGSRRLELPSTLAESLGAMAPPKVTVVAQLLHEPGYRSIEFGPQKDFGAIFEPSEFEPS